MSKITEIQTILGVTADGIWGPKSQAALNREIGTASGFNCDASSFADPADVEAFKRCKATGKTDLQCFAVGDNGIGQFGKITAQDHTPMVAVHSDAMKAKWGSITGAAHRPVRVTVNGKTVDATVEDRISELGRIDLNPAAAKQLGLKPPFVVPCSWNWA
jgi:peptidoglycan hydrolase-like protein with peptidoglycan-binding domain